MDHPTSGPVQTKDVADTVTILVHALIGDQMKAFVAGEPASTPLHMSQPGGRAPNGGLPTQADTFDRLANVGRNRDDPYVHTPARGRNGAPGARGTARQRRGELFGRRPGW